MCTQMLNDASSSYVQVLRTSVYTRHFTKFTMVTRVLCTRRYIIIRNVFNRRTRKCRKAYKSVYRANSTYLRVSLWPEGDKKSSKETESTTVSSLPSVLGSTYFKRLSIDPFAKLAQPKNISSIHNRHKTNTFNENEKKNHF